MRGMGLIRLIRLIGQIRLIGLIRAMGRIRRIGQIGRMWQRHYLLMDGMHSCAYIPRHTYKYLNKLLERRLEEDSKAENSLRFVWSRMGGRYVLAVNPDGVDMTSTHGLTRDMGGRILIPCPYIQQIYQAYGLEPEWCGRMYLEELKVNNEKLKIMVYGADRTNGADKADRAWLAMFAIHNA